jgi:sigma-B regulation protein RsbU (phosphoserine phosphatase)
VHPAHGPAGWLLVEFSSRASVKSICCGGRLKFIPRHAPSSLRAASLRACCLLFAALLGWLAAPDVQAQILDVSRLAQPLALDGVWLVHAGDDPAWAQPGFDDSRWTPFDPHNDIRTIFGATRPSIIWYRMRVKVSPDQAGLALREQSIARAAEVYVNGERFITVGQIDPFVPYTWNANVVRPIPGRMLTGGSVVIAMRVHFSPNEWTSTTPGYTPGNLTIGQQETFYRYDWLSIVGEHSMGWLDHLLTIALGVVALVLFAAQRRQTEYLWIAALGLLTLAEFFEPFLALFSNFPLHWEALYDALRIFTPYIWISLYFAFVGQRIGWRWRAILILAGLLNAFSGIQGIYLTLPLIEQFFSNLLFIILLSVVVPAVLARHWRRGNGEAGILLIPAVLFSLYIYAELGFQVLYQIPGRQEVALRGLNLIDRYPAGPFFISLDNLSSILCTLALAIIMLLRSVTTSRRQAILEGELAAAQQVQQVLLPEHTETVPGFTVETVYQPAQQVGGDFFQILPAGDGGLLAVVGDVAGKGLPAAMLVSALVGAIRGVAQFTQDPVELLASLNERLVGRGGGSFSTALVAHIAANGKVAIANAGHLSPYLDGRELELRGALPLGVLSGAAYEISEFFLAPGSRLAFYSDGVVEAQNQQGELFGFERAQQISTQPAAAIVEAASQFGQEDDITVVTITRAQAVASAA